MQTVSTQKVMARVFWDQKHPFLLEFMPHRATINTDTYSETSQKLQQAIQNHQKACCLFASSKQCTASRRIKQNICLQNLSAQFSVIDLAHTDYHLFSKLKEFWGGKGFKSDQDLVKTVTNYLNELTAKVYDAGIQKLVERHDTRLNMQGEYVGNQRKIILS